MRIHAETNGKTAENPAAPRLEGPAERGAAGGRAAAREDHEGQGEGALVLGRAGVALRGPVPAVVEHLCFF